MEKKRIILDCDPGHDDALAMMLAHGNDELDLLAVARPTASTALHVQMLGRGTRIADGKADCLVLDFAGNCQRLGPITAASVRTTDQRDEVKGNQPTLKVCPRCDRYLERDARRCEHCGHECPVPVRKIEVHLDECSPLVGDPLPRIC